MATSKRPFRVLSLDGGGVDLFSGAGLDGLLLLGVPVALIVGEEDREGDDCALSSLKRMRIGSGGFARVSAGDLFYVEAGLAVAGPLYVFSSPALREMTSTLSATMNTE